MTPISGSSPPPRAMMAPLPNCFSMALTALATAFSFSFKVDMSISFAWVGKRDPPKAKAMPAQEREKPWSGARLRPAAVRAPASVRVLLWTVLVHAGAEELGVLLVPRGGVDRLEATSRGEDERRGLQLPA